MQYPLTPLTQPPFASIDSIGIIINIFLLHEVHLLLVSEL